MATAKALILATRPRQWTKNLLVYFAFFFTINERWDLEDFNSLSLLFGEVTAAFVIFSALSGAIYLINDVIDVEKDRQHPRKSQRAIPSGQLGVSFALVSAAALSIAGLSLAFLVEPAFGVVSLIYLVLMVLYTLVLKQVVLLDVFSISAGFVLRAVAGAAVIDVPISPWLYICTGLGALFIALGKRRDELALAGENAASQRGTLEWYTPRLLDQLIAVVAPSTLLAYILYTSTADNLPDNHAMMLTIPFVVYGLFRYLFLLHSKNMGENPEEVLLTDVPLITSILLWMITAASVLLVFR